MEQETQVPDRGVKVEYSVNLEEWYTLPNGIMGPPYIRVNINSREYITIDVQKDGSIILRSMLNQMIVEPQASNAVRITTHNY